MGGHLVETQWLGIAFMALVVSAAILYTRRQPRIYEATTQLVIELHAPRYMNRRGGGEVVSLGSGGSWNTKEFFETQYRIIRSRMVAEIVVKRLVGPRSRLSRSHQTLRS